VDKLGEKARAIMNTIVFSTLISAIATVVIGFCAIASYRLASKIQKREKEYRQQVSDLYHAMVISNLLSTDSGISRRFDLFKINYKGETPISLSK
jgi:hypothetical protein